MVKRQQRPGGWNRFRKDMKFGIPSSFPRGSPNHLSEENSKMHPTFWRVCSITYWAHAPFLGQFQFTLVGNKDCRGSRKHLSKSGKIRVHWNKVDKIPEKEQGVERNSFWPRNFRPGVETMRSLAIHP